MSEPVYLEVRGVPIVGVSIAADLAAMAAQTPTAPDIVPDDLVVEQFERQLGQ